MERCTFHHVAISVADIERSLEFYSVFGFRPVLTWQASDDTLTIVHLLNGDGAMLEIVCYATNAGVHDPLPVGNALDVVGVKHVALHVEDLAAAHTELVERGLGEVTEIQHGRTRMDLFFVRDPDGMWVELLTEARELDPGRPTHIREQPRWIEGE